MKDDKLKVFFSGTFGEGTFSFNWDDEEEVITELEKDYRLAILKDVNKLFKRDEENFINDDLDIMYIGPYWAEHDHKGNHTTTDCYSMMRSEVDEINNSDAVVCVLSNVPSTGSCGELMHAISMNKRCHVFYQHNPEFKDLTIKARHWWIIAYAMYKRDEGYPIEFTIYSDIKEVTDKISDIKFYQKWKNEI